MLPISTCAKRDKYTTSILVNVRQILTMTGEVLTPSQIVEIVIFYCSPTDSNTFIRRMRENAINNGIMEGGGGVFFMNY